MLTIVLQFHFPKGPACTPCLLSVESNDGIIGLLLFCLLALSGMFGCQVVRFLGSLVDNAASCSKLE